MKGVPANLVRAAALAAGGGISWALALPSWHLVWLLLPGAFCLALMYRFVKGSTGAFFIGVFAGFCHWVVAVYWVLEVMTLYGHLSGLFAAAALALMSFILGLFWGLAAWVAYRTLPPWRPVVLALGLAAGELAQGLPPWNFPWNPIASALVPWPTMLASVSILGTTLFGFLLRVFLLTLAFAVLTRSRSSLGIAGATGTLLLAFTIHGAKMAPKQGQGIWAAAIQPNVPLEMRWNEENFKLIEDRVWSLSEYATGAGAEIVVWPESAVPRLLERDENYRLQVSNFAQRKQAWLVLNSIGLGSENQYFNSMYVVSPSGHLSRYDKVHLVPFGEYVPSWAQVFFLRPLVREVGSFTAGVEGKLLPGPAVALGGAICYEAAFPLHAAAQVRAGAKLLVNVTNDGWYGNSAAPFQHLALAILRALENRRYLVRAANTGISAIVQPNGQIAQSLGIGEEGIIVEKVFPLSDVPPAASWAELLHLAPIGAFVIAILFAVRQRR